MSRIIKGFLIGFFMVSVALADTTIEIRITENIAKTDPICSTCNLIIKKTNSLLLKDYVIFEVTTFDVLPPPFWHFAVKDDKMFSLDRRNLSDWNQVILSEKMNLDTDQKILDYAKFFLSTTMNQSQFIDKLSQGEVNQIESKDKKKTDPSTKITHADKKIQIVFYANDLQGGLQQWNLVLDGTGEILKLQEKNY